MNASSLPPSGRQLFDELQSHPNLRLQVGEHLIDVGALRVITRPELPRLSGKSLAVLIELVRHCGVTVTRGQLFERIWPERVITPDVLTQAIAELRRAFADDVKAPRYIETVPRVGYRLLAPVHLLQGETAALDPAHDIETVPADASNDDAAAQPAVAGDAASSAATRRAPVLATADAAVPLAHLPRRTLLPLWALLTALVAIVVIASSAGH